MIESNNMKLSFTNFDRIYVVFILLLSLLLLMLILLILCCFLALTQAVFNAEIFPLGELQLVTKDKEDAFTIHV